MNVLVTLDGVDGTGKSTIGRILARDFGYAYHKTPSGPFAECRSEIDKHATPLERYCYYRLATQYDSEQVEKLLGRSSVVCDRFIASTLAYHLAMDPRTSLIHSNTGIRMPDFAILLLAKAEERDRRIKIRAEMASDVAIEADTRLLSRIQRKFLSLKQTGLLPFALIPVHTDGKTPLELAAQIHNQIVGGENVTTAT